MPIITRLRVLLAEKAQKEKRNIPLSEVAEETGVAWKTLQRWANNEVTRYDAPVIEALCDYLDCGVGELIVYVQE
jgi:DNA-binding Xre family transcriptional regulator